MGFFRTKGKAQRTVERYVSASNANDIEAAAALMAADFRVIDSAGEVVEGRDNVREALRRFFDLAPDFQIEVTSISAHGAQVYIRGQSHCADPRFAGDELWRAVADGERIHEWQSFSRSGAPHLTRILMPELVEEPAITRFG